MVRIAATPSTALPTSSPKKADKKKVKKSGKKQRQKENGELAYMENVEQLFDELPEDTELPDVVASLDLCSLKSMSLTPQGSGWLVTFLVPSEESHKIPQLSMIQQRLACVHVVRQTRLHR